MQTIVIVHRLAATRTQIASLFSSKGFVVELAEGTQAAAELCTKLGPDVLIIDSALESFGALALLERLKQGGTSVPCCIVIDATEIAFAVSAIKAGAQHVLTGPVDPTALRAIVDEALEERRREQALHPVFIGQSAVLRRLEADARRMLASESPIYIHGETGTGKGVLARWMRLNGPRANNAFIDLNCATLGRELLESELFGHERGAFTGAVSTKRGLLEMADGGTLFLDEIGDLDLSVQPKLLKVLEEKRYRRVGDVIDRPIDVRFIAATHQDLDVLSADGRFRRDLYYRICILPLHVPPLRERREDIPLLAEHFIERLCNDLCKPRATLTEAALDILAEHPWPGNIRELRNAIERGLLSASESVIDRSQLLFLRQPRTPSRAPSFGPGRSMTLIEAEGVYIKQVLQDADGRVEVAATRLGISRSALYNKIKKHGLGNQS